MSAGPFLLGAAGFLVYLLLFALLLRIRLHIGWFTLELALGFAIHLLAALAGLLWLPGFSYWYMAAAFAFLWFCFFFASGIYSVSVSLGIIHYLYEQPGQQASLEEIHEQCIVQPFQQRADFLVAEGQARREGNSYSPTPDGLRTVERLRLIHKIMGMKVQGFYAMDEPASLQPVEKQG